MNGPALRIASARGVPGTAGAVVEHSSGTRYLLSNEHVVFGGGAELGDPVWAIPPERMDDDVTGAVLLGRVFSGRIGRVTFEGEDCFVDCALVELVESALPAWIAERLDGLAAFETAAPEPGIAVCKSGAATGRTEGVLVDIAYPDYPVIDGRTWSAPGQLLVDSQNPELNFSAPGDSGSALFDVNGRLLGLLWGSNLSGQGVACPIAPVLDCLKVTLRPAHNAARRFT